MIERILSLFQGLLAGVVMLFVLMMASPWLPLPSSIKLYTVRSGSMEPALHTGSLIFVRTAATYQPGDIITFKTGDQNSVTHRIIEKQMIEMGQMFATKGDANEEPDPTLVPAGDVIGKTLFSIPYLGFPVAFAQTKAGFLWLIVLPAAAIILGEALTIAQEARRLIRQRREPAVGESEIHFRNVTFTPFIRPLVTDGGQCSHLPPKSSVSVSPKKRIIW